MLLAETHLGSTLSRKRHSLSDVQGVLFLAAFGLRPGGKGCETWILTGHALRLAKRLSIDAAVWGDAASGLVASPAMKRTWLMLCAFDCFPSLGFGRPTSPRESLDACSKTIKEIKEGSTFIGSPRGAISTDDPQAQAKLSAHADAFVCAQVDLAQISRKLLDWVSSAMKEQAREQETPSLAMFPDRQGEVVGEGSWTSPEPIWKDWLRIQEELASWEASYGRKDSLLSNIDPIQRKGALLFHSHVKLCLASFALQLSEVVDEEARLAKREERISRGREPDEVPPFTEDDEFQTAYRKSGRDAASEMVRLHLFEGDANQERDVSASLEIPSDSADPSMLAFSPDYLLIALAQSAMAYVRLSSPLDFGSRTAASLPKLKEVSSISEKDFTGGSPHPILLLRAAETALASLDSARTGIAIFLRRKVKDALLAYEEQQENGGGPESISISRLASRRSSRVCLGVDSPSNSNLATGLTPSNLNQWSGNGLTDALAFGMIDSSSQAAHHNGADVGNWELDMPFAAANWTDWEKMDVVTMMLGSGAEGGSN